MATTDTMTIDSLAKAGRYLSQLSTTTSFDEALNQVRSRSSEDVARRLGDFESYIGGIGDQPDPEVALLADVLRHAPDRIDRARAIEPVNEAVAQGRALADQVRVGLPGDLFYAVLLLAVATIVTGTWLVEIAPEFSTMFESMSSSLPAYSQLLINAPWLAFGPIAVMGLMLVGLLYVSQRVARSIELVANLPGGWIGRLLGQRLFEAHDRWRTAVLARAWSAGGVPVAQAVNKAVVLTDASDAIASELTAELGFADELGVGQAELEFESIASLRSYQHALEVWRAIALRGMQVAIAVLVGAIVIAVYLPIFQLGAIV